MSLWIVDGGIGFTLPVIARVEDWKEGEYIDVTGAGDDGKWLPMPVRYVSLSSVHDGQREIADRIERLESENAKLRELVQYICDECYGDEWFVEKAAALGIEGHY